MAATQYTNKQIQELQRNKYVKSVTSKYITFTLECKIEFLRLANEWMFYRDIFALFGFGEYIVNSSLPQNCFQRWKRKEISWNIEWKRWRQKKNITDFDSMSIEEQNEYLRAENAYLKELHKMKYGHYP
jgi:hypothetical protein